VRPCWDHETRQRFVAQIRADSHCFLLEHGKPREFWGF
jgi:hypothetical protein